MRRPAESVPVNPTPTVETGRPLVNELAPQAPTVTRSARPGARWAWPSRSRGGPVAAAAPGTAGVLGDLGGWVGLGEQAGFGVIRLLPGIWDGLRINTEVTLPIGLETDAAYVLHVALSGRARPAEPERSPRGRPWRR